MHRDIGTLAASIAHEVEQALSDRH